MELAENMEVREVVVRQISLEGIVRVI